MALARWHVHSPGEPTGAVLAEAITKLHGLPQVSLVRPIAMAFGPNGLEAGVNVPHPLATPAGPRSP